MTPTPTVCSTFRLLAVLYLQCQVNEGGDSDDEGLHCIMQRPNPFTADDRVAAPTSLPSKAALCVTIVEAPSTTGEKAQSSTITDNGTSICPGSS